MSGVTHFERRDRAGRAKKEHPRCPFCNDKWQCTPRAIAKASGPIKYIEAFQQHLMDHLAGDTDLYRVGLALTSMRQFAPMVWDNC